MSDRHKGTIVRLYADQTGTVMVDMMKQGLGTSLFTFEVSTEATNGHTMLHFLELALIHNLVCVLSDKERKIQHVEIARFA